MRFTIKSPEKCAPQTQCAHSSVRINIHGACVRKHVTNSNRSKTDDYRLSCTVRTKNDSGERLISFVFSFSRPQIYSLVCSWVRRTPRDEILSDATSDQTRSNFLFHETLRNLVPYDRKTVLVDKQLCLTFPNV